MVTMFIHKIFKNKRDGHTHVMSKYHKNCHLFFKHVCNKASTQYNPSIFVL